MKIKIGPNERDVGERNPESFSLKRPEYQVFLFFFLFLDLTWNFYFF